MHVRPVCAHVAWKCSSAAQARRARWATRVVCAIGVFRPWIASHNQRGHRPLAARCLAVSSQAPDRRAAVGQAVDSPFLPPADLDPAAAAQTPPPLSLPSSASPSSSLPSAPPPQRPLHRHASRMAFRLTIARSPCDARQQAATEPGPAAARRQPRSGGSQGRALPACRPVVPRDGGSSALGPSLRPHPEPGRPPLPSPCPHSPRPPRAPPPPACPGSRARPLAGPARPGSPASSRPSRRWPGPPPCSGSSARAAASVPPVLGSLLSGALSAVHPRSPASVRCGGPAARVPQEPPRPAPPRSSRQRGRLGPSARRPPPGPARSRVSPRSTCASHPTIPPWLAPPSPPCRTRQTGKPELGAWGDWSMPQRCSDS